MGHCQARGMDYIVNHAYVDLCSPLPLSPLQSPNLKKSCPEMEDQAVSNADTLKAINNLNERFSKFEERVYKKFS